MLSFATDGAVTGTNTPLGAIPSLPATNIVINNGTLQSTGTSVTLNDNRVVAIPTSPVATSNTATINVPANAQLTIPGVISGGGILQKSGPGTLILSGANT